MECFLFASGMTRRIGDSYTVGVFTNILLLEFFCFHVVKPLMLILVLLPCLCVSEKRDRNDIRVYSVGN